VAIQLLSVPQDQCQRARYQVDGGDAIHHIGYPRSSEPQLSRSGERALRGLLQLLGLAGLEIGAQQAIDELIVVDAVDQFGLAQ